MMAHEIGHLRNGDGKTALQMVAMNAGFFAVLRVGMASLDAFLSRKRFGFCANQCSD